ncbi:MAG: hypothetical protein ACXWZL_09615, partial [Mycobacterium sp.]
MSAAGANFYVAPDGSPTNDGSQTRPLDLATALSSSSPARAGDTIWLRGGVYRGNFVSLLNGAPGLPVIVRQYPGERASIDGSVSPTSTALQVKGSYTWFWGFEVTNSAPNRSSGASSRGAAVAQFGPYTKLINLVIHDGLDGIQTWEGATEAEVYGNVLYNNGAEGSDRGHGHSMYLQNGTGVKRIVDNVLSNSYSFGIHAYTEGGSINNMHFEGNIAFNHGMLSAVSGAKANYFIGGAKVAQNTAWLDNYGYYPMGSQGRNGDMGWGTACNDIRVQDNYFAGGTALKVNCTNAQVSGNWLYGTVESSLRSAFPNNVYSTSDPGGLYVVVRPNAYEKGRANIAVYNWAKQGSVQVDISTAGLASGARYEIRDAQNFFGTPVVTGTYSGAPVTIPMTGLTAAQPVGTSLRPASSGPTFGAFVVLPASGSTTTPAAPTATFSVSPASVNAGQAATLSWSSTNATSVTISPTVGTVAASGSASVTPAQTTTYTLTASGGGGSVSRTVTVTVASVPASGTGTAAFVATDAVTQGSWIGKYGSEGVRTAADTTRDPAYAALTFGSALNWTWASSTSDIRALQLASGTGRKAATWYSTSAFTLDVAIADGQPHDVALYFLDWDRMPRTQTVDVLEISTGALLDRRTVSSFQTGVYLRWRVSGKVRFRFSGSNAVLGGVFFGAGAATTPAPPTPTATLTAVPASITAGQSATLSWTTANATSVSITPGVGTVAASGTATVQPTATTLYTLTATGAGGTATRTITVTV